MDGLREVAQSQKQDNSHGQRWSLNNEALIYWRRLVEDPVGAPGFARSRVDCLLSEMMTIWGRTRALAEGPKLLL